jgi:integrase
MKERKVQGPSLVSKLGMLYASLRHHPRHKDLDLSWFSGLIKKLPVESRSNIDKRKAKKYIAYAEADEIPARIRALRTKTKGMNSRDFAISFRNELLMSWVVIHPWRQRNLRECMITGDSPNLFKGPIGPFSTCTKADWLEAQEKAAPGSVVWQIYFPPEATKTKKEVQGFLCSELVPLLEEYLSSNRSMLIRDGETDPGTLFLSNEGKPMNDRQIRNLVEQLASQFAGVPVNPHAYRDITAFEWLRTHPEDFLTLQKILWHADINYTIKVYGSRFDESTGMARMDNWRANRRKAAG